MDNEDPIFYKDGQLKIISDPESVGKSNDWRMSGDPRLDFDPEDMVTDELETCFEDRKPSKNFMVYHLGTVADGVEKKIRVNCKWWPKQHFSAVPACPKGLQEDDDGQAHRMA